jgi:hypothetical protein
MTNKSVFQNSAEQMKDKLANLQATQQNKSTTMMETPRAIRPQDVEYQTLWATKTIPQNSARGASGN